MSDSNKTRTRRSQVPEKIQSLRLVRRTVLAWLAFLFTFASLQGTEMFADDEIVLFYPSCGHLADNAWNIELRYWVYEDRSWTQAAVSQLATGLGELKESELKHFEERARHFLADSESREVVTFQFDQDPKQETWQLKSDAGAVIKTDGNGLATGIIRLTQERADEIRRSQKSSDGWLTFRATSTDHKGAGRVRLIPPEGISIISDIDDTLKITEITAGGEVVFRNTFLKKFHPATELRSVFDRYPDAPVHYVSGGPWQMYDPLQQFLHSKESAWPEGTFHMRTLRKNLLTTGSWKDFANMLLDEDGTLDHKVAEISHLMERYPKRKFVLLGDSGEKDPEVYRTILEKYPERIVQVLIRDVTNDRQLRPERLKGMTAIEAPTVIPGKSQIPE